VAVTFDLFDTLVRVERPGSPAAAVAGALAARGISVPDDWASAYREPHVDVEPTEEVSLPAHVSAALDSRGIDAPESAVRDAVETAFEPTVATVPGAESAVESAAAAGATGVCSNCAVPGLATRALEGSDIDSDAFDAVVTSVGVGWRKPDERIFAAAADALHCEVADLTHVGDDPETDGGIDAAGGQSIIIESGDFEAVHECLEGVA